MAKKLKPIIILFIIVSIILFVGFFDYIVQNWPFIPYFDTRTQYRQYFSEFTRLIENSIKYRTFPFWSWNFFFGNNFWASKSYQILGDVFAYVTLMINGHVYNKILFITLLKYLVSALAFFHYLKYRNASYKTQIIGALLYAFSSYILRFTEQPFYVTFYVLIPFYLISVEQILHKKRPYLFMFMVGFLTITNYYLFYTTTLFSVIYFIYRTYESKMEFRDSIKLFGSFVFFYLIGFFATAFIILPTFYSIIGNPRIGSITSNLLIYPDIKTYFNIVMSYILPMQSSLNGMYYSSQYNLESYIWAGSITSLLLPQVFFDLDKNRRKLNTILFVFLGILLILPLGGSVLHGFSEPNLRWEFILLIFNLLVILPYLDDYERINIKVLMYTGLVFSIVLVLAYISFNHITDYSLGFDLNQIGIYIVYLLFYIIIIMLFLNVKKPEVIKSFLIVLITLELAFTTTLAFNKPAVKSFDWETIHKVESVLGAEGDLTKHLQTFDSNEEFYRVYIPYNSVYWVFSLNMNLIYDFMDTKTYDTTYQTSNNDLFKIIKNENYYNWFIDVKDPDVVDFVGVKYAIVTSRSELPHDEFDYLGTFNYLEVYKNRNYRGVFKSYNQIMTYEDYAQINDPKIINSHVIVNPEDFDKVESLINYDMYEYEIVNAEKYQNMLIANAENIYDVFVVSTIAYDEGWEVSINNNIVETFSTNGGFLSFNIPSGGGEIKLYFIPKGFKIGMLISAISGLFFLLIVLFTEIKRKKVKA